MTDVADAEVGRRGPTTAGEVGALAVGVGFGILSAVGLALAIVGWHRGWPVVAAGLLGTAVTAVVLVRRAPGGVTVDRAELGWLLAVVALASFFAFPGFEYGAKDKDPGTYVAHAFAIEREHSTSFPDPAFDAAVPIDSSLGPPVLVTEEGDVAMRCCVTYAALGVEPDRPDELIPSFFHAWPVLMATALSVGGRTALFNVGPLLAVFSVTVLFLTVRRGVGTVTALLSAGLLSTTMMQVWQARYPTTEVAMQATFVLAALGIAVGLTRRWRLPWRWPASRPGCRSCSVPTPCSWCWRSWAWPPCSGPCAGRTGRSPRWSVAWRW